MNRDVLLEMTGFLKSSRLSAGFTQAQLATKIGISRETVIAIENADIASVGALKIEVVSKWWVACKFCATTHDYSVFSNIVKKIFKIN